MDVPVDITVDVPMDVLTFVDNFPTQIKYKPTPPRPGDSSSWEFDCSFSSFSNVDLIVPSSFMGPLCQKTMSEATLSTLTPSYS